MLNRILKLSILFVLLLAGYNTASADTATGLVSHWKLDETSGATAVDCWNNYWSC